MKNLVKKFRKNYLQSRFTVSVAKCKGCGACKPICPTGAIGFFAYIPPVDLPPKTGEPRFRPQIDYSKCAKCNRCAKQCGNNAIEVFIPRLMRLLRK